MKNIFLWYFYKDLGIFKLPEPCDLEGLDMFSSSVLLLSTTPVERIGGKQLLQLHCVLIFYSWCVAHIKGLTEHGKNIEA